MKAGEEQPESKPFLTVQRISQEEIVCEGQKGDQLLQSVVCPVCLMLLPMPHYLCNSCDNAFCTSCIEGWWSKSPNSCVFKCTDSNFKLIKRSNTYNALMEILKSKCKHCETCLPIVQLESHDKACLRKPIVCPAEGCKKVYPRGEMELHHKNCEFLSVECPYCRKSFYKKDIQNHENLECDTRQVECIYKQCRALIKIREANAHQEHCLFKPVVCKWCKQYIFLKDKSPHQRSCPLRLEECTWCQQMMKPDFIDGHKQQCPERRVSCELCTHEILYAGLNQHRIDCVFASMVLMRDSQAELIEENVKLKQKVHELEYELQEAMRQNQEGAFNALIRVKEEEKQQFEKDIVRLNNGIANIQKLRNAEMAEHLKKPHISSSLCPFCNNIRNKLEEDLAPLLRQKEEVANKLMEVERLRLATVSSKVKMSRIRE